MFRNYLKTAVRNLLRNKGYAVINIVGLAVGIAASLLIFLVVQFELSFDKFHSGKEHIYKVVSRSVTPEGTFESSGVPFPVGAALRLDFPQLKKVARIYGVNNDQVTIDEEGQPAKKFMEERGIFFAEPEFFEIFNFPLLAGNPKSALIETNTVLLTQETAERYYGDWKKAIGKTIKYENNLLLKVTGILKNVPVNTDFPLKVVVSFETLKRTGVNSNLNDWISINSEAYCFAVLPSELSEKSFNNALVGFNKKHKPAEYIRDGLIVQPLKEMHFDDRFGNFSGRTFGRDIIIALILIGIFLLIIACVNFINLATAQAVNRSKEVGVRKVLGSNRTQLAVQFISETAVITLSSVLVAILIAAVALPLLNQLLQLNLSLTIYKNPYIIVFLVVTTVMVVLLSGFYPAMVLSGFNPITAIKSRITPKMAGGISLRRGLVVLQFAIAQVLIIGMLIVVSQMDYFKKASLGFNKDAIITVPIPGDSISRSRMEAFRDQLQQHPGIKKLTFSFTSPSDNGNWDSNFKWDNSTKNSEFAANLKWADVNYFNTYDLKIVAGREYYPSDTVREMVVNETFVKKLGIRNPQDVLGKHIDFWDGRIKATVVGVV
ncbi:MAG TPA: ABC transporter permease, partial [Chitinophagaceae bacterium]